MRFLLAGIVSFLLVSCGAAVAVDYDSQTDFSQYRSYDFYPDIDSGLNQLDDVRIMRIADSLLQQKGLVRSAQPDIYINFHARESVVRSRNTLGVGVGGSGRNVGVGVSGGIPIGGKTVEQRFTLDFVDVKADALLWQGIADGKFKEKARPEEKERYYFSLLQKILKRYPPGKK